MHEMHCSVFFEEIPVTPDFESGANYKAVPEYWRQGDCHAGERGCS